MSFGTLADLSLPAIMADIVNNGVIKQDIPYIFHRGGIMLLTALGGILCATLAGFFASRTALGFSRKLRHELFSTISKFSLNEFDQIGTASLITRATNDVTQVQQTLSMMMSIMFRAPIMAVGGIIIALTHDPVLSLVFAAAIPFLTIIVVIVISKATPLYRKLQIKTDLLNRVIREQLSGIRVIRAFTMEPWERKRFKQASSDITQTGIKLAGIIAVMSSIMPLIMSLTAIAIIWFGALRIEAGQMQTGDVMAFIQYSVQILFAIIMLSMIVVMLPRAQASAERINRVFGLTPDIQESANPVELPLQGGKVEFRNVSFKYHNAEAPALKNISFTAYPGKVTAIVGGTGSGKSSLIMLIPRFYDAFNGTVLVDDIDVKKTKLQDLRKKIGYVPQTAVLFTGSVADNISFGQQSINRDDIRQAAQTAQASEFVSQLEHQFDSYISQGGTNLSGGQKQRIAIARAIARNPEIYLFDDSFSALDFRTDATLRAALKKETARATVIIVAQRVATILNADNIIVLNEGKIEGQGSHADLMKSCSVYREIVYSQLSEEELA